MTIGKKLRAAVAAAAIAVAMPAYGAISDAVESPVEQFLKRFAAETNGIIEWQGADRLDTRDVGGESITAIENARFGLKGGGKLVLDHFELRSAPVAGDGGLKRYSGVLPGKAMVTTDKGEEVKITFNGGRFSAVVDGKGQSRESSLTLAGARIEDGKGKAWFNFGPVDGSTKIALGADGSWKAPVSLTLAKIEFFVAEGPVSGTVDRIVYSGESAGPDFPGLGKMRDEINAWQHDNKTQTDEEKIAALLGIFSGLPSVFSGLHGEFAVEKLVARAATGEALVSLDKARVATVVSGLSGDKAALRMTFGYEGFDLSPSILPAAKVPRRFVLDFGIEDAQTAPMKTMLEAVAKMGRGASDADKSMATAQLMGAVAMMSPVLRLYDAAIEVKDAGIDMTATASGSPFSPKGYTAEGDVVVRGIDSVPTIFGPLPGFEWLAFAKELGKEGKAPDGAPRLTYHLASAPGKWLTLNGADITTWFGNEKPGEPRLLKPDEPPMKGADVEEVQRALAAANLKVPQDGVYGAPTAVAVARYQKNHGLDVTGAVDGPTRAKLGIKSEPAPPAPAHPGAPPK